MLVRLVHDINAEEDVQLLNMLRSHYEVGKRVAVNLPPVHTMRQPLRTESCLLHVREPMVLIDARPASIQYQSDKTLA